MNVKHIFLNFFFSKFSLKAEKIEYIYVNDMSTCWVEGDTVCFGDVRLKDLAADTSFFSITWKSVLSSKKFVLIFRAIP